MEHLDDSEAADLDQGAAGIAARDADAQALARQFAVNTSDARLVVLGRSTRQVQLLLVRDHDLLLRTLPSTFLGFFAWWGIRVIKLDGVDSVDIVDSGAFHGAQGTRTVVIRGLRKRMIITLATNEAEYVKHYLQAAVRKSRSAGPQDSDSGSQGPTLDAT